MTVAPPASEIIVATANVLSDAPVPGGTDETGDGNETPEEQDEAEADAANPIAPPAPLINTRPLNPAVDVIEPVAGSGNPALIGSAVNEATAQGDTP